MAGVCERMGSLPRLLLLVTLLLSGLLPAQDIQRLLSSHQVDWDKPALLPRHGMPLPGIGGAGANVWFSQGELRLYLSHNGAYDADEVLRKIGSLRIRVDGIDLAEPRKFSQSLRLADGTLVVKASAADGAEVEHRLWFASETLVIETRCSRAASLEIAFGSWRAHPAARGDDQVDLPDGTLVYTHRNGASRRTRQLAAEQGLDPAKVESPASDRVYGCAIVGRDGIAWRRPTEARWALPSWQGHEWAGSTPPARSHLVAITLGAARKADPDNWVSRSRTVADPEVTPSVRKTAEQRWEEFWARSFVFVQPKSNPADPRFQVGRNYNLRRFMDACNQRGELPLRPNGGIYTVEESPPHLKVPPFAPGLDLPAAPRTNPLDPDWRRGGQSFVGQSLRWTGWPCGADGDSDIREPLLRFYRDRLPLAQARAKALGAEGAVYPERLSLAGLTDGGATAVGLAKAPELSHHFSSGFEHAWMAVRAAQLNGRDLRPDLPWILGQLRFIDTFHGARKPKPVARAAAGTGASAPARMVIQPGNALSAASGATNPAELVAALHALVPTLAALPEVAEKDKAWLRELHAKLPALPRIERAGVPVLALAERWSRLHDASETPELHALWPYRIVGRALPETADLAQATWERAGLARDGRTERPERRSDFSGSASLAYAASLGLAEECGRRALAKLADASSPFPFAGFAGPGREWVPDLTWSGSGRAGLQEMLVDWEPGAEGRILLLPAWPKDWDVTFRLRAPGNTRVTCVVESGKIERLIVDPPSRLENVVAGPGWQLPASSR